jgi:hypothetical protein
MSRSAVVSGKRGTGERNGVFTFGSVGLRRANRALMAAARPGLILGIIDVVAFIVIIALARSHSIGCCAG